MGEEELLRVQVEHLKQALEEQKKIVADLKLAPQSCPLCSCVRCDALRRKHNQ